MRAPLLRLGRFEVLLDELHGAHRLAAAVADGLAGLFVAVLHDALDAQLGHLLLQRDAELRVMDDEAQVARVGDVFVGVVVGHERRRVVFGEVGDGGGGFVALVGFGRVGVGNFDVVEGLEERMTTTGKRPCPCAIRN